MKRIGITGKSGFIGTHLSNTIYLQKEKYQLVDFEDNYFDDSLKLNEFVKSCDTIIHLAALNRHNDPQEIYNTNISLVQRLIDSLETTNTKPHIIFSSSVQEAKENPYGKSKKIGRELLESWAYKNNGKFTGLIIPNVFGPFGNPFYNSFIATFSYQLTRNLEPKIEVDSEVGLIFVDEVVREIISLFENVDNTVSRIELAETSRYSVSEVLSLLNVFKDEYILKGIIPELENKLKVNLFNTFRSYIDLKNYYPFHYKLNKDARGIFVELLKLHSGGQISYSTTKPGITRGNHFHTRKIERFAVIQGEAVIQMRKINTDEVFEFKLNGDEPGFVDMPIWYTHNITNIGKSELITLFWINEFYNPDDPDTYYEEV
jgi:UDP-2-acetamido-2,6-beta-L-arabino-hexul-4-ose reductase